MTAVHGSCLRKPRARRPFPLTTDVRPAEDKKDTPNPALRVKEKLLAVLKIIVKYQDK